MAVFTDKLDWHVIRTLRALRRQGATPVAVRLSACKIETGRAQGLIIPGFRDLPDLAIVRAIGDGSLEAITMRLGVLHALEALGVPVVNSARAIERCTDKSMASFLLAQAGLPTPQTFATQTLAQARAIARRECAKGPLVMKPLFGAQGWGLRLIERRKRSAVASGRARRVLSAALRRPGAAAIRRHAHSRLRRRNRRRHAPALEPLDHQCAARARNQSPSNRSVREAEIALAAAAALGVDFAGVDIINESDGAPLILEVNSMAGWSGLQRVTPFSIADELAADALAQHRRASRLRG